MQLMCSPLDCKEIQPVHPKGDQSWVFIGRTDAEAETPILWLPHAKSWLNGKDPNAGRDWEQEEKGMTEDDMPGWHHWLDAHEFGWTPGVGNGQGGLACCVSWGHRTELNWTECVNVNSENILFETSLFQFLQNYHANFKVVSALTWLIVLKWTLHSEGTRKILQKIIMLNLRLL